MTTLRAVLIAVFLVNGAGGARIRAHDMESWPDFYFNVGPFSFGNKKKSVKQAEDAEQKVEDTVNKVLLGGLTFPAKKELKIVADKGSAIGGKGPAKDSPAVDSDADSFVDVNMICGGPQIWNMLTASSSVSGVQNIKWSKMDAVKDDYLEEQQLKVKGLEVELESLAALIAIKKAEQQIKYTSPEQAKQLIEAALGSESFGGLDIAQQSGCGSVYGGAIKAPRRAFRKSEGLFEAAATQFFNGGQFRLNGDGFLEACHELLPQENERSYCTQLCQRFKDTAQTLSASGVGETTGNLDELLNQEAAKNDELVQARSHISQCTKAWDGISLLRTHIVAMADNLDERFTILQNAEMDLDDAMWELTDLEEHLKEEEQVLNDAIQDLAAAGVETGKASTHLQEVMAKEKDIRQRLQSMTGPLQQGRAQFEATKMADKTMVDLKTVVSATMVKMDLFAKSAVAEPLLKLGFDPDLALEGSQFFTADPVSTSAGGLLTSSVNDLLSYCSGTAMPAFAAVKEMVDLEPLCAVGETDDVMAGLNKAVLTRANNIKKNLLWVKSWLNPYRGNKKMTQERAAELVVLGEPKGFQEIVSVYHGTNFFKYLKDWRYGGPHLELLAQLKKVTQKLDASVHQIEGEIASLKADLSDLTAAREKAVKVLDEMVAQQNFAQEAKDKAQSRVTALKESEARMANQLADLEEAVRKATAAYEEAKVKLVTAHDEGVSALPHGKESMAELEAQSKEAKLLISLIEQSLAQTEESYKDSQSQLVKMQK
eukprot:CAMPEP_0171278102 /NCGR_PEP_ID=MMETSP0790-20130122/64698_1 /TAXON_ID=2925 /ORGANISM="Alexandrium catenella, Strain OF101" /LENGTH=768 /DNA_ID=CAMNT_0011747253 /DNA_START=80 /DNA_END=2386 /DNA_ORIENTATION=-